MKRFTFKLKKKKSGVGYTHYESQTLQYRRAFEKSRAVITTGHNGPKTGFARIEFVSTFFTKNELGLSLHRHFKGFNCYKQAEAWCNYLLNNFPFSHSDISRVLK